MKGYTCYRFLRVLGTFPIPLILLRPANLTYVGSLEFGKYVANAFNL